MKKHLILSTLLISPLFASITIELACDQGYPPYSYKENKVAKGVYVDVIKKAFSKIPQYDVKFKPLAWSKMEPLITNGKMIGHFPPYYNKDSTPWTELSEPILNEKIVVFAKEKIIQEKKNFPEDYKGLTMCQ